MSKKAPKWLDRALFINSAYYTLCTSEKLYKKALKHCQLPKEDWPTFVTEWHADATTHFFENRFHKKKMVVVCIKNFEDKSLAQVHSMLVHEAVHIWQQTREDYGEKNPSSELEAYAIQTISQRLMEEFERQTK